MYRASVLVISTILAVNIVYGKSLVLSTFFFNFLLTILCAAANKGEECGNLSDCADAGTTCFHGKCVCWIDMSFSVGMTWVRRSRNQWRLHCESVSEGSLLQTASRHGRSFEATDCSKSFTTNIWYLKPSIALKQYTCSHEVKRTRAVCDMLEFSLTSDYCVLSHCTVFSKVRARDGGVPFVRYGISEIGRNLMIEWKKVFFRIQWNYFIVDQVNEVNEVSYQARNGAKFCRLASLDRLR